MLAIARTKLGVYLVPAIATVRYSQLDHQSTSFNMKTFRSRKFRPSSYQDTIGASYRAALARHPFLLFGLPFLVTMVAGSFFLTPATALRYERHDRKVSQLSKEEELGLGKDRRKVDIKEEYYRLAAKVGFAFKRSGLSWGRMMSYWLIRTKGLG